MASVTFKHRPVTLLGREVKAGDLAPDFTALDPAMKPVTLRNSKGTARLFSVVPSLDTGVCSTQTKTFNARASEAGDGVSVITVSVDLPFAQKRWQKENEAANLLFLSDHRDLSFGEAYGVAMKELRLLARSIFVVDADDKVVYVEYVPEGTDEPDYEAALQALMQAAK